MKKQEMKFSCTQSDNLHYENLTHMTGIAMMTHTDSDQKQAVPPPRILVVEDDLNLLEGICNILEIDGYRVLTADNGLAALKVLNNEVTAPDLIVSDIMMPQMTGIELLEAVRRESRWLSIPFIFLTARGEKTDIQRGKELGVEDYIVKPYDPVDLLIAIRARIKRRDEIESVHSKAVAQIKRNILTILNHEFRTPLTFVVAYADMLTAPAPEQMEDSEMLSFLKGIGSGAERLRNLVENFILLVELETGEAQETFNWRKRTLTDVYGLLDSARSEAFSREGVYHACKIDVEQPIPPFVGDDDYLRRAVQHLMNNAIKFSTPDEPVMVRAWSEDGSLRISVQDYGRGIPAEEIDKIWDSFYQVNRSFYEDQGAGSGLAIAKRVAQLHGGDVTVESTFGQGSTFTISIPLSAGSSVS